MLSPLKPTPRPQKRTRLEPPSMAKKAILFCVDTFDKHVQIKVSEMFFTVSLFSRLLRELEASGAAFSLKVLRLRSAPENESVF